MASSDYFDCPQSSRAWVHSALRVPPTLVTDLGRSEIEIKNAIEFPLPTTRRRAKAEATPSIFG
jgi:hypothetical protein